MKLFNIFNWVQNLVEAFTLYAGGGGGGGPQTQTSYSTNLPEYAKPYYQELLKQTGKQVYETSPLVYNKKGKVIGGGDVIGMKEFTPYTGERIAGFTPEQQQIQREVSELTTPAGFDVASAGLGTGTTLGFGAAGAGLGQAFDYNPTDFYGGVFDPSAAAYYTSPYQQAVTDVTVREAQRQGDIERSRGAMGAINRGTFGGARQGLMQAERDRNLAQNITDIRAKGAQSGFENAQKMFEADQERRIKTAQLGQQARQFKAGLGKDIGLAGLQAGMEGAAKTGALASTEQISNLERLKAQSASAGEKQALEQEINNLKYQQFQEQKNFQKSQLEYLSNILRGNAAALGSTQTTYAPAPSLASQLGGAGLAGLGLYNIMGRR